VLGLKRCNIMGFNWPAIKMLRQSSLRKSAFTVSLP
jgi:hypothetical protein